jgi:hypothetical protein
MRNEGNAYGVIGRGYSGGAGGGTVYSRLMDRLMYPLDSGYLVRISRGLLWGVESSTGGLPEDRTTRKGLKQTA